MRASHAHLTMTHLPSPHSITPTAPLVLLHCHSLPLPCLHIMVYLWLVQRIACVSSGVYNFVHVKVCTRHFFLHFCVWWLSHNDDFLPFSPFPPADPALKQVFSFQRVLQSCSFWFWVHPPRSRLHFTDYIRKWPLLPSRTRETTLCDKGADFKNLHWCFASLVYVWARIGCFLQMHVPMVSYMDSWQVHFSLQNVHFVCQSRSFLMLFLPFLLSWSALILL